GGPDGDGPVALTLVDAIIVVVAFIEQAYPEVAQQLPPNLNAAFIELRDRDWAVRVIAFGEDGDYLSVLLPIAVLACYGAALWLAPDKRRAIVAIGISCVIAAALVVIGRDFGRNLVLDEAGFADQGATRAVWDVYTRPLLGWATILGVLGVLLAVGATGAHQRVSPTRQFEAA